MRRKKSDQTSFLASQRPVCPFPVHDLSVNFPEYSTVRSVIQLCLLYPHSPSPVSDLYVRMHTCVHRHAYICMATLFSLLCHCTYFHLRSLMSRWGVLSEVDWVTFRLVLWCPRGRAGWAQVRTKTLTWFLLNMVPRMQVGWHHIPPLH